MKINWQALRGQAEAPFLVLDLILLVLISLNIVWLLLDTILLSTGTGILLHDYFPDLHDRYRLHFHKTFLIYDTIFTGFLILELGVRWVVAIMRQTYYRWFFYPFVHWYDVLGIIPIPGFRILRLLRVISIVYRLHQLRIIDVARGGLFQVVEKYYRMVLEELSDRIVINVLEGMQDEIRQMGPVSQRLVGSVIAPRRDVIVNWFASGLGKVSRHSLETHERELSAYLTATVDRAFAENTEVQRLRRSIPVVGSKIEEELRLIVSGLLFDILNRILSDLGSEDNAALTDVSGALFDTLTAPEEPMNEAIRGILLDAMELIKAQVAIQQWKVEDQREHSEGPAPESDASTP